MADWLSMQLASLTPYVLVLLGLALVISSIGFFRTVYFISIGYAFSVTAMVIFVTLTRHDTLTQISLLQNIGLLIWSLRLGLYLLQRDTKPEYRSQTERTYKSTDGIPVGVKAAIWLTVSLLYVSMFAPSLFLLISKGDVSPAITVIQVVGIIVMFGGLMLESVADNQKAEFKKLNPKQFCNVGLYRWVRCPNYLGEILFWIGNWIIGAAIYATFAQWLVSTIGVVCITLIMLGSTKRLERSQDERYGQIREYQDYIHQVPVIVPFIPVYTLKTLRVFLE